MTEDDNVITAQLANLKSKSTEDDSSIRGPFRNIMKNVRELSSYGISTYETQYTRDMDIDTRETLEFLGYKVETKKIEYSFNYRWTVSW